MKHTNNEALIKELQAHTEHKHKAVLASMKSVAKRKANIERLSTGLNSVKRVNGVDQKVY